MFLGGDNVDSQGWIKLHRDIFNSDIWHDVTTFRLFIFLIGKASHQDGLKYKGLTLNKGQYVRSYRKLADDLSYKEGRGYRKYSLSTIKNCVKKLVDDERITISETEIGTLFTVVNYRKYQKHEQHFNGVNRPETPNEVRTVNETNTNDSKANNSNAYADEHDRTKNSNNTEVRTNAELMPNEVRTKSEQEQELKNLRIKELSTTTTTTDQKFGEILKAFEQNVCPLSPMQITSLSGWFDDFKQNHEIIYEAIKIATDRNRKNFGFVEFLLRQWADNNLENLDQVQTYERNKFSNQRAPNKNFRRGRTEKLPDWFVVQKESAATEDNENDDFDYEAEKRRLEKMFKEA